MIKVRSFVAKKLKDESIGRLYYGSDTLQMAVYDTKDDVHLSSHLKTKGVFETNA